MRKKLWRLFALWCALAVLVSSAPPARAASDVVASGECGDNGNNVTWSLDNKGTLTISGKGAMKDYDAWMVDSNGGNQGRNVKYDGGYWWSTAPWFKEEYTNIAEVVIEKGVTVIGKNAFLGCYRISKVTIPDSVIRIKQQAFFCCTGLTSITLPDSIAYIELATFEGCTNLVRISIPDTVTTIGNAAFYDCDYLTTFTIPGSVTSLGSFAFQGCSRLKSVEILGEITMLNESTFRDCPALTTVTLPESLVFIKEGAFLGCDALKDVNFTGSKDMWDQIIIEDSNSCLDNAAIHYDTAPTSAYKINSVSVLSGSGKPLTAVPAGSFLATVSVTNCTSGSAPVIFLAAYGADGQYQGLMYVTIREPVGGTAEITLPVDNAGGKISRLKAFAVKSMDGLEMIGSPVSFPAE